jgi:uncharacterized protein (DUF1330 family)
MTAYVVFFRESPIRDPEAMQAYLKDSSVGPFDMKALAVYGAQTSLEGEAPDGVVILSFPDVEEAKAWYYSPDYQARVPHRLKAADYRTVIVEGFDPR